MRILHAGEFKFGTANGSMNSMWLAAAGQARLGHDVAILCVGRSPSQEDMRRAADCGVRLAGLPCPQWGGFWRDGDGAFGRHLDDVAPEVVHLNYLRVPKFLALSRVLAHRRIPYVISLRGGMMSREMKRRYARKIVYWHLVEKRIHRSAAAIHFVTANERDDYYATVGERKPGDAAILDPIEVVNDVPSWNAALDRTHLSLSYFGRYDVWHKGLDLAAQLIATLRGHGVDAELHLYGSAGSRYGKQMNGFNGTYRGLPIFDHGFVDGREKLTEMARHDMYLQYSRFELFGRSLVEAMSCGVPALVSERSDLASTLTPRNAAIEIPMDPERAADVVANILSTPAKVRAVGERGREWVKTACNPSNIAQQLVRFYQTVA